MKFALVYQCGIANVFRVDRLTRDAEGRSARRAYQGTFTGAIDFARGARAAGATVRTYHCDLAGEVADSPWESGPGDLWAESKSRVGAVAD